MSLEGRLLVVEMDADQEENFLEWAKHAGKTTLNATSTFSGVWEIGNNPEIVRSHIEAEKYDFTYTIHDSLDPISFLMTAGGIERPQKLIVTTRDEESKMLLKLTLDLKESEHFNDLNGIAVCIVNGPCFERKE